MVILEILKPIAYKPIKWNGFDFNDTKGIKSITQFFGGDHPTNQEEGTVEIEVKIVQGSLDGIKSLFFITTEAQTVEIINSTFTATENIILELDFGTVFRHGLEYCTQEIINSGAFLLGFKEDLKKSLTKISNHRDLIDILSTIIAPTKQEVILNLARPAILCFPSAESTETKSHFQGRPKHNDDILNTNPHNPPLFHLATIFTTEIDESILQGKTKPYLSFYLNINNTEDDWPVKKNDYKVISHSHLSVFTPSEKDYFEEAVNFTTKEFIDLPNNDHVIIQNLGFSEEEALRYEIVRTIYMKSLFPFEEEVNKMYGYPDNVQGCVAYDAEIINKNREYGPEALKDAVEWVLLLQVDPSGGDLKFFEKYGYGTIYFMIQKQDLEAGNFENCQVVVQNT